MTTHDTEGRIKVGISIGDLNGIGTEVILKTFSDSRMTQVCTPVIYGSAKLLQHQRKLFNLPEINLNQLKNADTISYKRVNVINCWEEDFQVEFGKPSAQSAQYAFRSLEMAVADLASKKIDVLVTAPIDKHTMQDAGFKFPGHTEYLGEKFGTSNYLMFLVSENLRVGVVTGHIPIKEVASAITTDKILNKLKLMHDSLLRDFGIRKPRIAVLGLNPHAGDQGTLGTEDQDIIQPAVKTANDNGILAFGPYSADGFFGSGTYKNFDGVLGMYHDQGLVPFKALSFSSGVNFTAGLPRVRTSPDHGTGYDLAGKNLASESSFREAVYLAVDTFEKRVQYEALTANPLKISVLGRDQ